MNVRKKTMLKITLLSGVALALMAALCLLPLCAQTQPVKASALLARGYTVIPEPQSVTLADGDLQFSADWRLEAGPGVKPDDVALESLREGLLSRFQLRLNAKGQAGVVHLAIERGSVAIGDAQDREKQALAEQAYRMELSEKTVRITANAPAGLFYGVETLVQLVKKENGKLVLPKGQIVDWPDLQLRVIYWDDAHHLDRPDYLKKALRQAAFYKINGFSLKLEGHFQYKSAPALVEPYALSPAEYQELTDYGLRYHIQLIPFLDSPGHIAFILKHPEYAKLREYPESNYELCATNPDSYKLLNGMFQDLLDANKGVKYFNLSTDEPYYIGLANNSQCQEALRAKELGSVGMLLGEFLTKAGGYLHERGRSPIFWGEYPLRVTDIPSLPSFLINGEVYRGFGPGLTQRGIRQIMYVSTQGEERMFPEYYPLAASRRVHPGRGSSGRVQGAIRSISSTPARKDGDLMGVFVAAWADAGLHQETFWLGYTTIASAGWRTGSPDPAESIKAFYTLFYGRSATKMERLYELMSTQAQFYSDSWDTGPSDARKPILGSSRNMFDKPRPANDQRIPLPGVPSGKDLSYESTWSRDNAKRLQLASESVPENEELLGLLEENLRSAEYNRYSLEVFRTIARLYQQNLDMLAELGKIDGSLVSAQQAARAGNSKEAVGAVDRALNLLQGIRSTRNSALADAIAVWYKTWYPRVAEANGRRFLHELDDIKDHHPDRTVDMSYLVYRELLLPCEDWFEKVQRARNEYAQANGIAARHDRLNWKNTTVPSRTR